MTARQDHSQERAESVRIRPNLPDVPTRETDREPRPGETWGAWAARLHLDTAAHLYAQAAAIRGELLAAMARLAPIQRRWYELRVQIAAPGAWRTVSAAVLDECEAVEGELLALDDSIEERRVEWKRAQALALAHELAAAYRGAGEGASHE